MKLTDRQASRREENRREWIGYFERLADGLRSRAGEYDERARKLARAAYHEGTERGMIRVVDAYVRERPEEGRRWERYVEARTKAELPAALSAFPPPKPAEL